MSKYLDELKDLADAGFHEDIIEQISSLGENARRMLEIGIVQDRLVELGFKFETIYNNLRIESMFNRRYQSILFWQDAVTFELQEFFYDSPTWQEDLINKVKELISCNI